MIRTGGGGLVHLPDVGGRSRPVSPLRPIEWALNLGHYLRLVGEGSRPVPSPSKPPPPAPEFEAGFQPIGTPAIGYRFNWHSRVQEQRQTSRGAAEIDRFFGVQISRSDSRSNLHRGNGQYALLQLELDEDGSTS